MSYRKKHIKNKIHRIMPRKSLLKRRWFWILLVFFLIIAAVFYFVLFYPGFQVKNIMIFGNEKLKTQDLHNFVRNNSSKRIFLVSKNKLEKDILQNFPAVEKISIIKNFPRTLVLEVSEKKAAAVYCPLADGDGAECFFIDKNGVAFEPSPPISDSLAVVEQEVKSGQIFAGEQVAADSIIKAVFEIQKSFKDNFNIDLVKALITSPVRLNIKTNEGWEVYFDLSSGSDINLQLTKLSLILKDEISQTSRKNLKYIDLRPKDRAIICDSGVCGN